MAKTSSVPHPTESELAILQVLWSRGPSSVREVWRELGEKSGYTTVLKFLQIMLAKGLVRRDERLATHVYEAAVTQGSTQDRLVVRLLDQVFSGSASQLVMRALSSNPISTEELKAIRAMLAEKERKQK
jgi:BlaI family penicillinase repressor